MVSETMAEQEENGCRGLDSPLLTSVNTSLEQLNNPGDVFAPKVRKPYTITKQRERWTEEEHKKFLEALKLYGRAWRRIEEHVGTKTAVQIRSHAQKFFSKVTHETNTSDCNSVKSIEIPPPRPKRKPIHPYPRKMVTKGEIGIPIPEKFSNAVEQENQSLTSVLSGIGSDSSGGADSCTPNGNRSSVSSEAPKLVSEDILCLLPEREDKNSSIDGRIHMESDLSSQNDTCVNKDPNVSATQRLKLFGKTLLITDPSGLSDKAQIDCKPELLLDKKEENCSIPWGVVPLNFLNDDSILMHSVSFPWLTLCNNVQTLEVHNPTPVRARYLCDNNNNNKVKPDDNELFSFKRKGERKSFSSYNPSKKRILGFVPYKRCSDKWDSSLLQAESGEERETQHVRLCL
ncbi:homeodomain-like superfamily protein [Striga asiatica]|uniref:Homeodomain-like superfamily protein n=1 Tax=Striga asiatica TaxID=4170 RepID=A0A5A7P3C0_STRAF|nr:homeodomain-like superfamily protein [Striga asiatica]